MAMHAGMGLSKVALLIGAGFTGSILVRNGKLSDILAELQTLLKSTEDSDSDSADSVALQVSRLAMEIRQLVLARSITVVNGGSGQGNVTSFLVPAATLGTVGYGYMWWKATKRHLTQRIEGLDGKLDEQKLMTTKIRDEVTQVRGKLENIGFDLSSIQQIVFSMDGKMNTIERKQAFLCAGIHHLCNTFPNKEGKLLEFLQEGPKLISNMRGYIGYAESANSKEILTTAIWKDYSQMIHIHRRLGRVYQCLNLSPTNHSFAASMLMFSKRTIIDKTIINILKSFFFRIVSINC